MLLSFRFKTVSGAILAKRAKSRENCKGTSKLRHLRIIYYETDVAGAPRTPKKAQVLKTNSMPYDDWC